MDATKKQHHPHVNPTRRKVTEEPFHPGAPAAAAPAAPPPRLVGAIVEKGFSAPAPSTLPQPTALPFPVARHRSCGPHWTPASSVVRRPGEEEGEDMEVGADETDYSPISGWAEPVKRKEKKGMDFSRWRELALKDADSTAAAPLLPKRRQARAAPLVSSPSQQKQIKQTVGSVDVQDVPMVVSAAAGESKLGKLGGDDVQLGGSNVEEVSLAEDVGAENAARLAAMSEGEIAEAQAEILDRMDPVLVEMLKRRGREKSGSKKGSGTEKDKWKTGSGSGPSVSGGKATDAMPGNCLSAGVHSGHSWQAWSNRVERIRLCRFVMDGDILGFQPSRDQHDGKKTHAESVAERDYLRTEGDPAALGYTINEAISLMRSIVPGQRVLALQLLASILSRALQNLQKMDITNTVKEMSSVDNFDDWQAVWAYALGPEPQLILAVRIAFDDSHASVVLACARVICFMLSYDMNETFFDISEKLLDHGKDISTAPIFRSTPDVDGAFLHGGFWKYNTKPSNILPNYGENDEDEDDEKHTIQDDVTVSSQDVAAGLIKMGILPKICFHLEMDPSRTLEDYLVSILVALARHSPQSADAVLSCPRLIESVLKILNKQGSTEIHSAEIKVVTLLKVLSKYSKQTCLYFMEHRVFQQAMWHWYRKAFTLEDWLRSGKEQCRHNSAMMVEQLRFWRSCISYGFCVADFTDFFPVLCLWLSPPVFQKLTERNVLIEFCSITREAYLVLGALAQRLPVLHSVEELGKQEMRIFDGFVETWSWSHVIPMVESAMQWLAVKDIPYVSSLMDGQSKNTKHMLEACSSSLLFVISAVLHMLSSILDRISPGEFSTDGKNHHLPWMPEFVPKIGLCIIDNGFFNYSCTSGVGYEGYVPTNGVSLAKGLCYMRSHGNIDASLSSVSCLQRLVQLSLSVDKVVQRAKRTDCSVHLKEFKTGIAGKILEEGISKLAHNDLSEVLTVLLSMISTEWPILQNIEMFGRGGPAPGVGFGWGCCGGGFWSLNCLLAQLDSQLVLDLIGILSMVPKIPVVSDQEVNQDIIMPTGATALHRINSVLEICLIAGPGHISILQKAFDVLFQASVMKCLDSCTHYFASRVKMLKSFEWKLTEDEYLHFSSILSSHYRSRWLDIKKKSSNKDRRNNRGLSEPKRQDALESIREEAELPEVFNPPHNSLVLECAHQRLPLPAHWTLSAICCIGDPKSIRTTSANDAVDVSRAGLIFVLGLEAFSALLCYDSSSSPILHVPLVWKVHALSASLHLSMDWLQEDRSRDVFYALQELYGQHLDTLFHKHCKSQSQKNDDVMSSPAIAESMKQKSSLEILGFQAKIHESYTTFVENLVEQFAAESYGDIIFGRQVAIYLHRSVEPTVRVAAWNALSNACALELLPPLDKCIGEAEGYLEPVEDNEGILEAYAKSWTSGVLLKAYQRESVSFILAKHHLSCFIFQSRSSDKLTLRNKLVKSIIRFYSQKGHHEVLHSLILQGIPQDFLCSEEVGRRIDVLRNACEGNSSLLAEVERLSSSVGQQIATILSQ